MPTPPTIFLFLAATLVATSCANNGRYAGYEDPRLQGDLNRGLESLAEANFSWWDNQDNPANGPLRVTIDLSDQAATFYRRGAEVGRSRVATGLRSHRTPTGEFSILEKTVDKHSNLYGHIIDANGNVVVSDADSRKDAIPEGGSFDGASMPYWMRLTAKGVGMHAGPIPRPGQPASHGCIRMPEKMARRLFDNSEIGTPVTIVP